MTHCSKFHLLTKEELVKEYKSRKDLLPKLIGDLYPQIIWDEMAELEKLITGTGHPQHKLPL